jgi:hypothetical protein
MADDDGGGGGEVDYYFLDDDQAQVAENVERFCKVYDSEDFFTVFVQMLLAIFALLSLWFKRQSETPRRKFRTWFLDVSKQGVGACYAHVLNMVRSLSIDLSTNDVCLFAGLSQFCCCCCCCFGRVTLHPLPLCTDNSLNHC